MLLAIIAMNSITRVEGIEVLIKKTSENNIKLEEMVSELKEQNESQQISLEKNEIELNELKDQTKALYNLLDVNNKQLQIQNVNEKSISVSDFYELEIIIQELNSLQGFVNSELFSDMSKRENVINYLNAINKQVYAGMGNKIVKLNDKIYSQWWLFHGQIKYRLWVLNGYVSNNEKYYGYRLKKSYANLENELISEEEDYIDGSKLFKNSSLVFYEKGIKPIFKLKEYINKHRKYFNTAFNRK